MAIYRVQPNCNVCGTPMSSLRANRGKHFVGDNHIKWYCKVCQEKAKSELKVQTELTPKLANKILADIAWKKYKERISQEQVLHHLKQLKAEMGRLKNPYQLLHFEDAVKSCQEIITKKIAKIKKQ